MAKPLPPHIIELTYANYPSIRPYITTGSLFFTKRRGPIHHAISYFSPVSHIGALWWTAHQDILLTYESTMKGDLQGVGCQNFSTLVSNPKIKTYILLLQPLNMEKEQEFISHIELRRGTPYEKNLLKLPFLWSDKIKFFGKTESLFCSELIADLFFSVYFSVVRTLSHPGLFLEKTHPKDWFYLNNEKTSWLKQLIYHPPIS